MRLMLFIVVINNNLKSFCKKFLNNRIIISCTESNYLVISTLLGFKL